ncbi:MAG TPA: hypothetical protein VJ761_17675 [Ktedonobacteraceae bacterium]|nr:hypothetical protein [Ktedonobacteraceae bacterium]
MQPEVKHPKNPSAVELGRSGGKQRMAQLNSQQRSAFSKHALRARWHRREFEAEKEEAQRKAYLFQQALQALQNDKQLPLV